jgi:hypothetical protein
MVLKDTVNMMTSEDYKERFKAEYYQLKVRINGLENMLKSWDEGTLNFKPTCPRKLYDDQLKAMYDYINILITRSKMEGIDDIDFSA